MNGGSDAKQVIEEVADWIDDAFNRYGSQSAFQATTRESTDRTAPKNLSSTKTVGHSPLTSETETDDSGITFVPKRYHDQSRRGSPEASPSGSGMFLSTKEDSSGSEATLVVNAIPWELQSKTEHGTRTQTPDKASTPRLTGQTISETELMRRRRLLDAHIFD